MQNMKVPSVEAMVCSPFLTLPKMTNSVTLETFFSGCAGVGQVAFVNDEFGSSWWSSCFFCLTCTAL